MAWSYMSYGKLERAIGLLQRLIERHPDRFAARGYLADCYEMLGRDAELKQALRLQSESTLEFLRRHPDDPLARVFLAIALVRSGDHEAAIAQAERAVALAPDDGRIRYNAACAFARAGLAERAIAEMKAGIGNIPSYFAEWPRRDPDLVSLHDHPEFIRMFGKVEA
jgi:predicted Zn-dependent protease